MNEILEKETSEDKVFELDNEFILRLPHSNAKILRTAIQNEVKHLKNRLQIQIEPNMRRGLVKFDDWTLEARIYDLPTTIESQKTLDRKVFYKVGDICHIMVCKAEDNDYSSDDDNSSGKLDKDGREKKYLYPHGITPSLKNVRKRRFRKTLRNKYTESPSVEKEVKMLLKTDAEAVSSRFEIVSAEDERANEKADSAEFDIQENDEHSSQKQELGKYDIFGEVSSSSEDSDHEIDVDSNDTPSGIPDPEILPDIKEETDNDMELRANQSLEREEMISEHESKAAELNLGHILEKENNIGGRDQSYDRLTELRREIDDIQVEKVHLEDNLLNIENLALKERLQLDLDNLNLEEQQKKEEYSRIVAFLQQF